MIIPKVQIILPISQIWSQFPKTFSIVAKQFNLLVSQIAAHNFFYLFFVVRIQCKTLLAKLLMIVKYQVQYNNCTYMNTTLKIEQNNQEILSKPALAKKEKIGRWSPAQCYYFESLLQRFGKNWKKIQQHMKNRSLSQIRSHAQKYFDKIGAKRVEEYQRKAKLLEAYETLQKQKKLREEVADQTISIQVKTDHEIKQEESTPLTVEVILPENSQQNFLELMNIKEQVKQSENLQEEKLLNNLMQNTFPFLNGFNYFNGGFLLQIIGQNPEPFIQFRGIQPYVDCPEFRAAAFKTQE